MPTYQQANQRIKKSSPMPTHHQRREQLLVKCGRMLRTYSTPTTTTTSTDNNTMFCSKLAMFFTNRVNSIKVTTAWALAGRVYDPLASDLHHQGPQLCAFASVTEDEVTKLIGSMPAKSSPLDFVPTSLLKACRYMFVHVITRLANLSFEHATFPAKFKTVSVTPLLKDHRQRIPRFVIRRYLEK